MPFSRTATFQARYDQVAVACDFVAEAAVAIGLGDKAAFQVQLACDEACTNIVEHAYRGQDGHFEVNCRLDGRQFIITIRDNGRTFDPQAIPAPFIPSSASQAELLEVGGLGLHFMRKLMDEVRFNFTENGNELVMVKTMSNEQ